MALNKDRLKGKIKKAWMSEADNENAEDFLDKVCEKIASAVIEEIKQNLSEASSLLSNEEYGIMSQLLDLKNTIEDLSEVTELDHVLEIFVGDRNKDILDWNSLVEEERKRQEKLFIRV